MQLLLECRCGFLCALGGRICCSPLNWALGSLHLSRADPEIHNHFALSPFALAQHDSAVEKLLAQAVGTV